MTGGKPRQIDWDLVEKLMAAGCSGVEIAADLGINQDTLYDRTREKYGVSYSVVSCEKRSSGKARLRLAQQQSALDGNTQMLLWLGKVVLEQKEPKEDEEIKITPEEKACLQAFVDQVSALRMSSNSSRVDEKSKLDTGE